MDANKRCVHIFELFLDLYLPPLILCRYRGWFADTVHAVCAYLKCSKSFFEVIERTEISHSENFVECIWDINWQVTLHRGPTWLLWDTGTVRMSASSPIIVYIVSVLYIHYQLAYTIVNNNDGLTTVQFVIADHCLYSKRTLCTLSISLILNTNECRLVAVILLGLNSDQLSDQSGVVARSRETRDEITGKIANVVTNGENRHCEYICCGFQALPKLNPAQWII